MAKRTYGKTWWGKEWLQAIQYIDYNNRLARGKAYANKGAVLDFEINENNEIQAEVSGSSYYNYTQTIKCQQLSDVQKKTFIDKLIQQPYLLSKLLNRNLPKELIALAKEHDINLIPKSWKDLKMNCSCPDWAKPCKHLAAVIYIMVSEIDQNPFLVFKIKGLHIIKELKDRGLELDHSLQDKIPQLIDYTRDAATFDSPQSPSNFLLDFSHLVPQLDNYYQLLPNSQSFFNGKLKDKLLQSYKKTIREYKRSDFDYSSFEKYHQLIKNNNTINLIINRKHQLISLFCPKPIFMIDRAVEQTIGVLATVKEGTLNQYPDNFIALYHIYHFAIAILLQNHYLPRLIAYPNGYFWDYTIQWIPAYNLNTAIDKLVHQLVKICPSDLLLLEGGRGKLEYIDSQEQIFAICHLFISYFVEEGNYLQHEGKIDKKVLSCFFNNQMTSFEVKGEQQIPTSLQLWLNRFYMGSRRFNIVLQVEESLQEETEFFFVHLLVSDQEQPQNKAQDWQDFLDEQDENTSFKLYKELDILCEYYPDLNIILQGKQAHTQLYNLEAFSQIFFQILPILELLSIPIILPRSLRNLTRPRSKLAISQKTNEKSKNFMTIGSVLEFDWEIALGEETLSVNEFMTLIENKTGLVKVKDTYIHLDKKELQKLIKQLEKPPKVSEQELLHAALSGRYQEGVVSISETVSQTLSSFEKPQNIAIPHNLKATLRPYQEAGFAWMYKNSKIGLGSLIADDMGLGKTIQVLALLLQFQAEKCFEKKQGLIVVPTSLLSNWEREIWKFAPDLTASVYHGGQRVYPNHTELVITTYGIVRSDLALLKKQKYHCIIIDEAQNIKNTSTAQSKAVKSLKANLHIAMSGTPVENRLSEYWSILDFTNKGYLGSLSKFISTYSNPIQLFNDQQKLDTFRKITAPFILRRLKTDRSIIKDLPDKIESNYYTCLTTEQSTLYQKVVDTALEQIAAAEAKEASKKDKMMRRGLVLKLMGSLKQVANHPYQYLGKGNAAPSLSGKGKLLLTLLDNIQEQQEKVLIFTQYQKMGKIMLQWLTERYGRPPLYLHGGTPRKKRDEMVDAFQNNKKEQIFILSLKAAGTGLNLTAANHVIHYDLWWNPAVEAQATDRAYRIGQQKNVQVYRFISKGTLEEKIDEMIQSKKELADLAISTGEKWIGDLSSNELSDLVRLEHD